MNKPTVISLGGSVVNPNKVDSQAIKTFIETVKDHKDPLIIVVGGGSTARTYQQALKDANITDHTKLDWVGIKATYINAELVRYCMKIEDPVIHDPSKPPKLKHRLVSSGWKPGWSTDYVAVTLAKAYGAQKVINLTNTPYVYDMDPKKPEAKPLKEITYAEMKKVVGSEWTPGLSMPFDPIAVKLASESNLKVFIAKGMKNLGAILKDQEFEGTLLHN